MTIDLEAITARADAATEGPWRTDGILHDQAEDGHPVLGGGEPGSMAEHMVTWVGEFCNARAEADAEFIAAARTDVPELVAEVKRLTEDNARLTSERESFATTWRRMSDRVETAEAANEQARREVARLTAIVEAVERLVQDAEAGEGIVITPGFTTYFSVETGLLRIALSSVCGLPDTSGGLG